MKKDSSKNKKYIFLNADGTLNTGHWHSFEDSNKWRDKYGLIFYQPAVKNLATIIEATGAEIFLFHHYSPREMWQDRNLPGKVIDSFIPRTDIQDVLNHFTNYHKEVITGFVIIDSIDDDILPEHHSHLVLVNPETGITQSDAERAIKILNMGMNINYENSIGPINYPKPFSINTSVYLGKFFDKLIHGSIKDDHSNVILAMHLYGIYFGEKIYYSELADGDLNKPRKVTITDNGISIVTDSSKLHNNDVDIILSFHDDKLIIQSTGLDSFGFNKYYSIDMEKNNTRLTKRNYTYYSTDVVYNKEHGIDHELVPSWIDIDVEDDLIQTLEFHYYHKGVYYRLLLMMSAGLSNRNIKNGPQVTTDYSDDDFPF